MKKLIFVSVVSLGVSLPAVGGDSSEKLQSGGGANGRVWEALSIGEKTAYIGGTYDALVFVASLTMNIQGSSAGPMGTGIAIEGLTYDEISKVVDAFYADAANARVPITFALAWAKRKVSGDTVTQLDALAANFRRAVAKQVGAQ
jgi:hypothetical protein